MSDHRGPSPDPGSMITCLKCGALVESIKGFGINTERWPGGFKTIESIDIGTNVPCGHQSERRYWTVQEAMLEHLSKLDEWPWATEEMKS